MRNLIISMVLGLSSPSTLNLNFRCNLSNTEIESLQRLLFSIGSVQLSSSTADSRGSSLPSIGLFIVKSVYLDLSMTPMTPSITLFHPAKFLWSSKAP